MSAFPIAKLLHDWLPNVVQEIEPWFSQEEIQAGMRWSEEIASELSQAAFGIVCVTPDSTHAPWLLFEAGALSARIAPSRVCPYLFNIVQADLDGPLTQFEACIADREGTLKMVKAINELLGESRLQEARLLDAFTMWWPRLEEPLAHLARYGPAAGPRRPIRESIDEMLVLMRGIARESLSQRGRLFPDLVLRDSGGRVVVDPVAIRLRELELADKLKRSKAEVYDALAEDNRRLASEGRGPGDATPPAV